tara:strand:+ start:13225 stop:14082 length:858 start_codon:yes stop_codon:yes gene_type:complete
MEAKMPIKKKKKKGGKGIQKGSTTKLSGAKFDNNKVVTDLKVIESAGVEVTPSEFQKNSDATLQQAKLDAVELGLDPKAQTIVHQAKDGTWLPGADGNQLSAILEDEKIKEADDNRSISNAVKDVVTLAKEDLVRDNTNRGKTKIVTGQRVTLIAREVQQETSVDLLVTGMDSGAQKRVTVKIKPGESRLGRPFNGELPNFNFGAGDIRRRKKKKKSLTGLKKKRAQKRKKAATDRAKASIANVADNLDVSLPAGFNAASGPPPGFGKGDTSSDGIDDGVLNMEK